MPNISALAQFGLVFYSLVDIFVRVQHSVISKSNQHSVIIFCKQIYCHRETSFFVGKDDDFDKLSIENTLINLSYFFLQLNSTWYILKKYARNFKDFQQLSKNLKKKKKLGTANMQEPGVSYFLPKACVSIIIKASFIKKICHANFDLVNQNRPKRIILLFPRQRVKNKILLWVAGIFLSSMLFTFTSLT